MAGIVSGIATSCSDKYTITGTAMQPVTDSRMVYLRQMEDVPTMVDSCEIVHGSFKMSGTIDSVMCLTLDMGSYTLPIVLEQGNICVSSANSSIKVEGTPLNDRLYRFLTSRDSLIMLISGLGRQETQMILDGYDHDAILRELGEQEGEYRIALDKLETEFVTSNFDNVLGVSWFLQLCDEAYKRFGYATTTPQIDEIYGLAPEEFRNRKDIQKFMNLCK